MFRIYLPCLTLSLSALTLPVAAFAEEADNREQRIRIALGPALGPAYPGADRLSLGPFFDFSSARGNDPFAYEAPDESFGFPLIEMNGIYVGPTLALTDKRKTGDTTAGLSTVDTTFEAGISLAIDISPSLYAFTEVRRGIGGHDAWTGNAAIDYILRDSDNWLVSFGPRLTWGDGKHARTYFGVSNAESIASGLPAYDAGGGIESAGATLGALYQIDDRWGIAAYVNYSRLVGDAADSPIVRNFGDRDQMAGGIAVSYSFTRRRN